MIDIDMGIIEKLKFITSTLKTLGESKDKFDNNLEIKHQIEIIFGEMLGKLQDMLDIKKQ